VLEPPKSSHNEPMYRQQYRCADCGILLETRAQYAHCASCGEPICRDCARAHARSEAPLICAACWDGESFVADD
jgi:rubrerythrin